MRRAPSPLGEARWSELVWQVALGAQIHGAVFEDAGDGPVGRAADGEFRGTFDGATLAATFHDPSGLPDRRVLVDVLGKGAPQRASTSYRFDGRALELALSGPTVTASW